MDLKTIREKLDCIRIKANRIEPLRSAAHQRLRGEIIVLCNELLAADLTKIDFKSFLLICCDEVERGQYEIACTSIYAPTIQRARLFAFNLLTSKVEIGECIPSTEDIEDHFEQTIEEVFADLWATVLLIPASGIEICTFKPSEGF